MKNLFLSAMSSFRVKAVDFFLRKSVSMIMVIQYTQVLQKTQSSWRISEHMLPTIPTEMFGCSVTWKMTKSSRSSEFEPFPSRF